MVTELNYNRSNGGTDYPGNEAFAAVKAHGATLRKIGVGCGRRGQRDVVCARGTGVDRRRSRKN